MTAAIYRLELRLRLRIMLLAGAAVVAVAAMTGALFPAISGSLGKLDLGKGVSDLIGGGDFSTIAGFLRTEIVSIYGPLVVGGVGIAAAAATIAGEEEDRILALVLAHPVPRARLLVAKAAALATWIAVLGVMTFFGLALAVAFAGGGLAAGDLAAQAVHLVFLGWAFSALALALSAVTGRRSVATGGAAAAAVLMFLVYGFAPSLAGADWLRYLTLFEYYEGEDPLTTGIHIDGLAVMLGAAAALTAVAIAGFARRDLRG